MTTKIGKSYYECHVTILCDPNDRTHADASDAKFWVEKLGWKFSQIDGDIALGDGVKCYATMHFSTKRSREDVVDRLHHTADLIAQAGFKVIRKKVEEVIYDDRSVAIQPGTCEGACVECHLDDYAGVDLSNLEHRVVEHYAEEAALRATVVKYIMRHRDDPALAALFITDPIEDLLGGVPESHPPSEQFSLVEAAKWVMRDPDDPALGLTKVPVAEPKYQGNFPPELIEMWRDVERKAEAHYKAVMEITKLMDGEVIIPGTLRNRRVNL